MKSQTHGLESLNKSLSLLLLLWLLLVPLSLNVNISFLPQHLATVVS